jgi:putative ABC transport system permease protein
VTSFIAWRILTHEIGRNLLAIGGIFIAVLMIFLQLGFYFCVPKGGMLIYDHLRFDLLMASSSYIYQGQSYDFPLRRLYQALALPEVESAAPFYQGDAQWLNKGVRLDVFVMGFKLEDDSFTVRDIERQLVVLQRPDTVLVDTLTLPMYGPLHKGQAVEIGDRTIEIGGQYSLGTGFVGFAAVVASDLNFARIFPGRPLEAINLGLLRLKQGSDREQVATRLRSLLPADTQIFTRSEIEAREVAYWSTRTATGLIFGFGVLVSIVGGGMILYQTLATQVTRLLPQYMTLKAIGHTDGYLRRIVLAHAMIITGIAFAPAVVAALVAYEQVRAMARLPIEMTAGRIVAVLVIVIVMSTVSAITALQRASRHDPADLL